MENLKDYSKRNNTFFCHRNDRLLIDMLNTVDANKTADYGSLEDERASTKSVVLTVYSNTSSQYGDLSLDDKTNMQWIREICQNATLFEPDLSLSDLGLGRAIIQAIFNGTIIYISIILGTTY